MEFPIHEDKSSNSLTICIDRELGPDEREAFAQALAMLLESRQPSIVIDMASIWSVSSLYLGSLVTFADEAMERDKTVTIHMQSHVARLCKAVGLEQIAQIIEV